MNTSDIREHMKVIGSDRQPVGTVDHMEGDKIKLAKGDAQAGGKHHLIPAEWVESIDGDQVLLRQSGQDARAQWQDA